MLKVWKGKVVDINVLQCTEEKIQDNESEDFRYVGISGMKSVAEYLAKDIADINRPVWVSKLKSISDRKWELFQYGDNLGIFDVIIIGA